MEAGLQYPKLDRRLHLLMLMHRQLEEARALGGEEPWLEFREEPSWLTIRVTGTSAVEEVRYGGSYRGDEMVEEPGEALRSLSADGYVDLEYGDAGPVASVGGVAITAEGLEKIRYRRAFESNLPRYLRMTGISLLGGVLRTELWRANWEGHNILVKNKSRLVPRGRSRERGTRTTEYLNVDGRFPPGYKVVGSHFSKDLYGELRTADGLYEIYAHIGLTAPLLKTGCLISVDGVVIGGDVGKRFLT